MTLELISAVISGEVDKAKLLLDAGGNVEARDAEDSTLLMLAAATGNLPMVELLVNSGASVNARDERGWSPLMKSVYNAERDCGFPDVAEYLIAHGADVEAAIGFGVRPLMLAAGYGEIGVVETLLKAGADVLARNEGGFTALMMVKQKHYVDVINRLHEAERDAGVEEGSCATKNAPGVNVVTFLKPLAKSH
ncbi:MAG: ankyrin repeat domain-containing protein [Gallionella sp.]|jgi:ankyrin repeat protein